MGDGKGAAIPALFPGQTQVRIGVARDKAFSFYYEDNFDLLRESGAQIVAFSPLADAELPRNLDGLYLGGGYPELYPDALSHNESMLAGIRALANAGKPIYAECGGMTYLGKTLTTLDGHSYSMTGLLPMESEMTPKLVDFGYVDVEFVQDCLLGEKGTRVRGHSFHCSRVRAAGATPTAYHLKYSLTGREEPEGYQFKNVLASYVHLHFRADPDPSQIAGHGCAASPRRGGVGMKQLCALLVLCIALPAWCARTVTDELGRRVVVPDHPHRLVCLMPSVVDDVYALGAGADVIAVTDYTKYPAEARTTPSVGSIESPSIETIVSLHPDLVLESAEMSRPETVDELQRLGIPVFVIAPHGVEGIYQSITSLGQALNREEAAKTLVDTLRRRVAAVRREVSGKPVVSVLMLVGYNPIITIGSTHSSQT